MTDFTDITHAPNVVPFIPLEAVERDVVEIRQTFGDWQPPDAAEWNHLRNPHLVALRYAWRVIKKTPVEVREMVERLKSEPEADAVKLLQNARDVFEIWGDLCDTAAERLISHGAK